MRMIIKRFSRLLENQPILFSALLHILLCLLLAVTWTKKTTPSVSRPIIYATLSPAPSNPSPPIKKPTQSAAEQRQAKRLAAAKRQAAKLAARQLAIKRRAAAKKRAMAKRLAIKRQRQQRERAAKRHAAALKRREEKKQLERKLAQQMAREQAERQMQARMAEEEKQLAAQHSARINREINRYKALLIAAIGRRWLIPKGVDRTLSCQLLIHVAPGGTVLAAQLIKSSGNVGLDRSVLAAVRKASPLPVPSAPELFDKFRQLRLTVRPEDVV